MAEMIQKRAKDILDMLTSEGRLLLLEELNEVRAWGKVAKPSMVNHLASLVQYQPENASSVLSPLGAAVLAELECGRSD